MNLVWAVPFKPSVKRFPKLNLPAVYFYIIVFIYVLYSHIFADVKNIILKDLGGVAQYRRCALVLEICIGFLAATGIFSNIKTYSFFFIYINYLMQEEFMWRYQESWDWVNTWERLWWWEERVTRCVPLTLLLPNTFNSCISSPFGLS